MAVIPFNATAFRALFPAFSNAATYPDAKIQIYWDMGTAYVIDNTNACFIGFMSLKQQTLALNLITAHLLALSDQIAAGNTPGLEQAASIDKVSVTLTPPPLKNQWQWWLSLTPYGQELLALFQIATVGGQYYGGRPVLASFRR